MTIQEEAQTKIDKEKRDQQIYQMKCRLEQMARKQKELAELADEIVKIEVAPLPTELNCTSGTASMMSISSNSGLSNWKSN